MYWEKEAEALIKQVPFFIRGRVKKKVEEWVRSQGKDRITKEDVLLARERFQSQAQVKEGFVVEGCFGASSCPNAITQSGELLSRLEAILKEAKLTEFLREKVKGPLKHHHQFRVALSECPNACSQVQIRDFAIMGQVEVQVVPEACVACGECLAVCEEGALSLAEKGICLDGEKCLRCGACIRACPTGALALGRRGYRLLIGGKLGRHPQFAREIVPLAEASQVEEILRRVIVFYKRHNEAGERLGTILSRLGWEKSLKEILS